MNTSRQSGRRPLPRPVLTLALVVLTLAATTLDPAMLHGSTQQPPSPGAAQTRGVGDDAPDVRAAAVPGSTANPVADPADCLDPPDPNNPGVSRYFVTVRSAAGQDINNATGTIIARPGGNVLVPGQGGSVPAGGTSTVAMTNGDYESLATDGTQPTCVPAANDGRANDLASPPARTFPARAPVDFRPIGGPAQGEPLYDMVITAPGFVPVVIPLPVDAFACGFDVAASGVVCLISMGIVTMTPVPPVTGRAVVTGSVYTEGGRPVDGAPVVLTDATGVVHTRVSGTDCNGNLLAPLGSAPTGFYCFSDSAGDKQSGPPTLPTTPNSPLASPNGFNPDGLGMPPGQTTVTAVYDVSANALATYTNCPPPGAGTLSPGSPGSICGLLPRTENLAAAAGAVTGQNVVLANKTAPGQDVTSTSGANAFGYVVDNLGSGVAAITVTATGAGIAAPGLQAFCPGSPATQGTCANGLWVINGLPANSAVTFTISGAGLTAQLVRPALAITRNTTANGTWIDPSWVITRPTLSTPGPTLPPVTTSTPTATATSAACPLKAQGDANCDGRFTLADYTVWRNQFLGTDPNQTADFNGDGRITLTDYTIWRNSFLGT